jgi:hypothetical protein
MNALHEKRDKMEKSAKPPYVVEFHASYGHALLAERYSTSGEAIQMAKTLQSQVTDDACYCVSNKDQELVWPPRSVLFPLLPFKYEEGME